MIILGHPFIPYDNFELAKSLEDIRKSPSNSTVVFLYDFHLMEFCFTNKLHFGVYITSIKEAIFANNLGAKYLIQEVDLASKVQKIAENYMFDSKVIACIKEDVQIENIALLGIDGVIYDEILKNMLGGVK